MLLSVESGLKENFSHSFLYIFPFFVRQYVCLVWKMLSIVKNWASVRLLKNINGILNQLCKPFSVLRIKRKSKHKEIIIQVEGQNHEKPSQIILFSFSSRNHDKKRQFNSLIFLQLLQTKKCFDKFLAEPIQPWQPQDYCKTFQTSRVSQHITERAFTVQTVSKQHKSHL